MDIDVLTIDQLVGSDPSSFADGESIEALFGALSRLESFVTEATAAFDAAQNWVPDGALNAATWVAARCRLPRARARQVVRRGRELRHLPETARAFSEGAICSAQVDAMVRLRRESTEEDLRRDEAMLVEQARKLRFESFARVVAYWDQLADPDGVEVAESKRRSRREVYLDQSFGGVWLGKITLDPIAGAIVSDELKRIEQALFEAEWAEARTSLGREPTVADLVRTPGQRRADALVEMATRSGTAPADGRRPAPLFSVLVGYETLRGRICELARGSVVTPGSLVPWLDEAIIERAVFGPAGRVEVSATARLFTGATRRAIQIRDRHCAHPYCDVPAERCDIDHILPYAAGGSTTQENGRVLCAGHNRLRNVRQPLRE